MSSFKTFEQFRAEKQQSEKSSFMLSDFSGKVCELKQQYTSKPYQSSEDSRSSEVQIAGFPQTKRDGVKLQGCTSTPYHQSFKDGRSYGVKTADLSNVERDDLEAISFSRVSVSAGNIDVSRVDSLLKTELDALKKERDDLAQKLATAEQNLKFHQTQENVGLQTISQYDTNAKKAKECLTQLMTTITGMQTDLQNKNDNGNAILAERSAELCTQAIALLAPVV